MRMLVNAECGKCGSTNSVLEKPRRHCGEIRCMTCGNIIYSEPMIEDMPYIPKEENTAAGTGGKRYTNTCAECGQLFETGIHTKKTCSHECWQIYQKKAWQARNEANRKIEPRYCKACGAEFMTDGPGGYRYCDEHKPTPKHGGTK